MLPENLNSNLAACGGTDTVFSNNGAFVAKCKDGNTLYAWGWTRSALPGPAPSPLERIRACIHPTYCTVFRK